MPSSAARRRAATLVLAIVLHGARALGQDPYGASPGEPGFGGRPPPGAPRQRQPSTRPSDAPETHAALKEVARSTGERIGAEAKERAAPAATREERLHEAMAVLAAPGYEPSREGS